MKNSKILIVDFGSQYTQLIARRTREMKVYCEIVPYHLAAEKFSDFQPNGVILSGGPASVYDQGSPMVDTALLEIDAPILGVCYGLQIISYLLKGKVHPAEQRGIYRELSTELRPPPSASLMVNQHFRFRFFCV